MDRAEKGLASLYGRIDLKSPMFPFDFTDYYERQMGKNLQRKFLSFGRLIAPERLGKIKRETNRLEIQLQNEMQAESRIVNLDPGYLTTASLIMATAKNFAHRIPLENGIYAHLEFLFGKEEVRCLEWTYPDFENKRYHAFFLEVRRIYLTQLKEKSSF
jgi:hypothetical protein